MIWAATQAAAAAARRLRCIEVIMSQSQCVARFSVSELGRRTLGKLRLLVRLPLSSNIFRPRDVRGTRGLTTNDLGLQLRAKGGANTFTVYILSQKNNARAERLNKVLRKIFLLSVQYECIFEPFWIASESIFLADALSRDELALFLERAHELVSAGVVT